MKKLTTKQQKRLQELKERNEVLDGIITDRIYDHKQSLPLNLILEARFNGVMQKGIALEGEIAHLQNEQGDANFNDNKIEVKRRRLDILKGSLDEIKNIGDMLEQYDAFGREFEIVRK